MLQAMEKLVSKGLVKAIGISNFTITKTERLLQTAKIVPAVNQIEYHPYLQQEKLKKYCNDKGMLSPKFIEFLVTSMVTISQSVVYKLIFDIIVHCINSGIVIECYSPLGNVQNPYLYGREPTLLEDPVIKEIAAKHRATVAQVN